jgi:RNA polymerase sigma-70 factor, ECF subfamily
MTAPDSLAPTQLQSFTMLFERYHAQIFRYFRAHQIGEEDAADLTQQVFAQAWAHRMDYQPERGTPAAWIFGIARNLAADFFRRSRPLVSWEAMPAHFSAEATPEEIVLCQESLAFARSLIAALPADEQELLALRFAGQLTHAEIATLLGKSEAATKKRFARLLQRLQDRYRRGELDDLIPVTPLPLLAALEQIYQFPIPLPPTVDLITTIYTRCF